MAIRYCTRCVYPSIAATPLTFDEHGVCSGCRIGASKKSVNWAERWAMLEELTGRIPLDPPTTTS